MLFTNDELSYLASAVESYSPEQMSVQFKIKYEKCKSVHKSCLDKLNNLSGITYFTAQEYICMTASIENIIDSMTIANQPVPLPLYALHDKCMNLLEKASNPRSQ